jgi:hypothetical protein
MNSNLKILYICFERNWEKWFFNACLKLGYYLPLFICKFCKEVAERLALFYPVLLSASKYVQVSLHSYIMLTRCSVQPINEESLTEPAAEGIGVEVSACLP